MSSSVPSKITKVDELTADNYVHWRSLQISALRMLDVYRHVDSGVPNTLVTQPAGADAATLQRWLKEDALAVMQIKANVSSSEVYNMKDEKGTKTAYELWTTLQSLYTNTSLPAKMALQVRLQRCKLQPDTTVQQHSNGIRRIADQLAAGGAAVDEANLTMHLLASMPSDYIDVVTMLKYSSSTTYTSALQTLIDKEGELKTARSEDEHKTDMVRAYLAESRDNADTVRALLAVKPPTSSASSRKPRVQCEECGKPGHRQDTCWTLHPELRPARRGRRAEQTGKKRQRPTDSDDSEQQRGGKRQGSQQHSAEGVRMLLARVRGPQQSTFISSSSVRHDQVLCSGPPDEALSSGPPTHDRTMSGSPSDEALCSGPPTSQTLCSGPSDEALCSGPPTQDQTMSGSPSDEALCSGPPTAVVTVAESALGAFSGRPADAASQWYLDSGATRHMCDSKLHMRRYRPITPIALVGIGDTTVYARGEGDVLTHFMQNGKCTVSVLLTGVLHAPGVGCNLIAVNQLMRMGQSVTFEGTTVTLRDSRAGGRVWSSVQISPVDGLVRIATAATTPPAALSVTAAPSEAQLRLWHDRLGHLGLQQINTMRRVSMADGADSIPSTPGAAAASLPCDSCHAGKSHRVAVPQQATHRATRRLQLVHSDVCGPINVPNYLSVRYILTFIDDYSRSVTVYLMDNKSGPEVLANLKDYQAWAETTTGEKLATLRTDGGGEFINREAAMYLSAQGIARQTTPAYTPEHNGVAERANRTIMSAVRCMLHRAHLSNWLWPEAVKAAVYIRNRSPTRALVNRTPYEAWTGVRPSIHDLRVFGCIAHVHIPAERRQSKLSDRSTMCVFVGYSLTAKAYRLYNPATGKIVVSRDVSFEESRFVDATSPVVRRHLGEGELLVPSTEATVPPPTITTVVPSASAAGSAHSASCADNAIDLVDSDDTEAVQQPIISVPAVDDAAQDDAAQDEQHGDEPNNDDVDPEDLMPLSSFMPLDDAPDSSSPVSVPLASNVPAGVRRSGRGGGLPSSRAADAAARHQALVVRALITAAREVQCVEDDPVTYTQAMEHGEQCKWLPAMQSELDSIGRTGTWVLVELPIGRAAIGCKWVYKTKYKADGSVDRHKARLVAKGFSQKEGVDYKETFAPVAKFTSIRMLLALAAKQDLEVHQMDVKTAFLHGDLEEDIYMRQPEGFTKPGQEHLVCLLKKSLYGLKQANRAWYHKIHAALAELGFTALESDNCIYVARHSSHVTYIALYVDDLLLISSCMTRLADVKRSLSDTFEMTDLGEAQYILGLQITRDRSTRTLSLSQAEYVRRVVERYNMSNAKVVPTPLAAGAVLTTRDCPSVMPSPPTVLNGHTYASIVGEVMYAMLGTRPDLAFAIGSLSRFNSNPGQAHWIHLKRVLRYLAGSITHKLTYGSDALGRSSHSASTVYGYCDADWASSIDDRRSITGWVYLAAGGAISWQSQKQRSVALSTVEAEYMAQCQAAKEAIWLSALTRELGVGTQAPMTILTDSQGAMALAKNPEHHQRSKHIDIRYHFLRDQVTQGTIELLYVPTRDMAADQLTKPLSRDQHERCIRAMGLCCS